MTTLCSKKADSSLCRAGFLAAETGDKQYNKQINKCMYYKRSVVVKQWGKIACMSGNGNTEEMLQYKLQY